MVRIFPGKLIDKKPSLGNVDKVMKFQNSFHHRNDVGCNEASGGNVLIELAVFGEKILLF